MKLTPLKVIGLLLITAGILGIVATFMLAGLFEWLFNVLRANGIKGL